MEGDIAASVADGVVCLDSLYVRFDRKLVVGPVLEA